MTIRILIGDYREKLREMANDSVDSCVCDPPYHIGFMGQRWDGGDAAFQAGLWAEVLRVLKPGAHLAAFGGTRTYHRLACAIEDAGFEIRDQLGWAYGSGFPKSLDVSKQIDKAAGAERAKVRVDAAKVRNPKATGGGTDGRKGATRPWIEEALERGFHEKDGDEPVTPEAQQWQGWGTALKPAWEPICLARKPLIGTVAANVLKHGTGAINIDGCRIEAVGRPAREVAPMREDYDYKGNALEGRVDGSLQSSKAVGTTDLGRWPANIIHDGSDEVLAGFPETAPSPTTVTRGPSTSGHGSSNRSGELQTFPCHGDSGSAARFFYCAKASKLDRLGSDHPTVKPVALMRWLVRLVTPPGGLVLDPFAGTGSTGIAAYIEGFNSTLIELRPEAAEDIERRIRHIQGLGRSTAIELAESELRKPANVAKAAGHGLPLFGDGG